MTSSYWDQDKNAFTAFATKSVSNVMMCTSLLRQMVHQPGVRGAQLVDYYHCEILVDPGTDLSPMDIPGGWDRRTEGRGAGIVSMVSNEVGIRAECWKID